jgi:two-component system, LuxR family, sensor kinase FixL
MSWITVIWSMIASACLTMAAMHLFIWCRRRQAWGSLLLALSAVATIGLAVTEVWMMRSATTTQFASAVRWYHVPVWALALSLVGFVRFYLRAGRPWLAWTVLALRTLVLAINFIVTPNLNYREITSLQHIPFLGESISVAQGVPGQWIWVGYVTLALFVYFIADAFVTVWRRGDRRQAVLICGSTILFVAVGMIDSFLVYWIELPMPFIGSWFYMGLVIAMGYETSRDVLRAGQLAGDLQDSEYRMALATETAHLGVWMRDIARSEVWASDSWRRLFGFGSTESLDVESILQRLHPDDREAVRLTQSRILAGDGRYDIEFRVLLPDGQVRWIATRGGVTRANSGKSTRVHGVSIDITQRKQAEERFRLAVEASPNAMVMVDREGHIVLLNTQAESVFGYSREELLGRSVELLIPDPHRSTHAGYRQQYLQAPSMRAMGVGRDLHGRRKDGSEVLLEVGLNPIKMPDGMAVLASIVDISARRRGETEMAQQRNELAHLSRVTMLGELSGSLAHELNQPLMAILSNAQAALRFLERDPGNLDEVRQILLDIAEDDKRAGEVIRRLRSMLKKDDVRHVPLDVNEVVRDVLKIIHSDLINRKVTVSTDLAADLPAAMGDRVQMQQVVLNLIMNGCDAMDGTSGERRLELRTAMLPEGDIEISVTDRGSGIPPEDLEQIFAPFVSTKSDGMGLGLAVCLTIVNAHGGRLWATNNTDRGATFHVTLPRGAIGQ